MRPCTFTTHTALSIRWRPDAVAWADRPLEASPGAAKARQTATAARTIAILVNGIVSEWWEAAGTGRIARD